jgi:hypothetical protein
LKNSLSYELIVQILVELDVKSIQSFAASSKKTLMSTRNPRFRLAYLSHHFDRSEVLRAFVNHPGLCDKDTIAFFASSPSCDFSRYFCQLLVLAWTGQAPKWLNYKCKWGKGLPTTAFMHFFAEASERFGEFKCRRSKTDGHLLIDYLPACKDADVHGMDWYQRWHDRRQRGGRRHREGRSDLQKERKVEKAKDLFGYAVTDGRLVYLPWNSLGRFALIAGDPLCEAVLESWQDEPAISICESWPPCLPSPEPRALDDMLKHVSYSLPTSRKVLSLVSGLQCDPPVNPLCVELDAFQEGFVGH